MISDFFNSVATVKRVIRRHTAMGGVARSYETRIAQLPCRLSARNIRELDQFGKMTTREVLRLYCAASGVTIEPSDRIFVDGRKFEIKGVKNPGLLNRHLEVDVEEID